jgi:hypothetical protein
MTCCEKQGSIAILLQQERHMWRGISVPCTGVVHARGWWGQQQQEQQQQQQQQQQQKQQQQQQQQQQQKKKKKQQ